MNKVLILGGSGMLGHTLFRYLLGNPSLDGLCYGPLSEEIIRLVTGGPDEKGMPRCRYPSHR